MRFLALSAALAALVSCATAISLPKGIQRLALNAAPTHVSEVCAEDAVVDSVSLRADGVKVTTGNCASGYAASRSLEARATKFPLPDGREPGDECDTPCHTVCFKGTRSPKASDCDVVYNALAADNGNFTLGQNAFVLYSYQSCATSFTNQIAAAPAPQNLTSCYRDWKDVGSYVSQTCVASDGYAGGKCVARFGSYAAVPDWYLMVFNA